MIFTRATAGKIKAWRMEHGYSQQDFWGRIGVTQSGGSRYERNRRIPKVTLILLNLAYGDGRRARKALRLLRTAPVASARRLG